MLILSRRTDEAVIIGEGDGAVRVMVVEIDRGKVRLGFTALDGVRIDREEVRLRTNAEQAACGPES